MPGPAPKPDSKRRRSAKPKSYGAANPTTVPAASDSCVDSRILGIDNPHQLVTDLWTAVGRSCESSFYSDADWQRLRLELFHLNALMTGRRELTSAAWSAVQAGLNELLLSPAIKRRAGIEVKPTDVDADAVAAVSIVGRYQQKLKPV